MSKLTLTLLFLIIWFSLEIAWIFHKQPTAKWQTIRQFLPKYIGFPVMAMGIIYTQPFLMILGGIIFVGGGMLQRYLHPPSDYQIAKKQFGAGNNKGALELISKYILAHPESCEAFAFRSQIHLSLGELAQAEKDAQRVKQLNPNSPLGFRAFGRIFYFQGRYQEAKEAFTQVLNLHPDQASDVTSLGQTYYRLGEYEAAIECLKAESSRSITSIMVHYYLGRSFEQLGYQKQADEAFKAMRRFGKGLKELKTVIGCWSKDYSETQLLQEDILNMEKLLS